MDAYLIGHITIKDPVQWKIYVEGVQKSFFGQNEPPFFAARIHTTARSS